MDPDKIRRVSDVIAREKATDVNYAQRDLWLMEKAVKLHRLISLPEGKEFGTLGRFIEAYVDFLPDCLEHFNAVAEKANISAYTDIFLNLAVDFFISPPQGIELETGFGHLIDEAYMAHRLLEELNDRCLVHVGGPGLPADTAYANVIMHSIIGDGFANELDMAVHYAIEANIGKEKSVLANLKPTPIYKVAQASENWSVFGEDLLINITFKF